MEDQGVLNDDQQKKFDQMREEQRSHMRHRMSGGNQQPEVTAQISRSRLFDVRSQEVEIWISPRPLN